MANPIRSTDLRSIVEPLLNEEFDGVYNQRKDEWKQVFRQFQGTPRAYHEEPILFGFGPAQEVPDGSPFPYFSGGQLPSAYYYYKVYGGAFALTRVLVEDGEHVRIGSIFSRHLAQSMVETKELLCANILNRAFNSSYTGSDGVSLVSSSHVGGPGGGSQSNVLSTPAALSQTSLEQMLIQIWNATDSTGKRINLRPTKIVTGPSNAFQSEVLLKSALRTGTANNDINPINSMGTLADGAAIISRITSTTAWFVETDAPEGLKLAMRAPLQKSMEGDFDTDSMRYKASERYIPYWTDWRGIYGTAGV